MKIAYFSPFPPKRTGVALYSDQLVREVQKLVEVDCYDFDNATDGQQAVVVKDFATTGQISQLSSYDAIVYQMGNNPYYHLEIYQVLRQVPGIVVLHDVILYYLFAGFGLQGLRKHLWLNGGRAAAAESEAIVAESPEQDILRYRTPVRYPLTASIFPYATRIVVHNKAARDHLLSLGCTKPIHVVPLLAYSDVDPPAHKAELKALRLQHSLGTDHLVIGCFGFIGPTKRISQICRALQKLKGDLKFRFLIVGEGDDLTRSILETGISDVTMCTGFVDEKAFSSYLQLTDIFLNLRHPSMGESSATLTRAMMLGKACIVSDDAAFAELPDSSVVKIGIGEDEISDLTEAIHKLAIDTKMRGELGTAARNHAESAFDPSKVALQFQRILQTDARENAQNALIADAIAGYGMDTAWKFLIGTFRDHLPPHLQGPPP
jgi:glycosyltransferase involved in cell wall biosynthesis